MNKQNTIVMDFSHAAQILGCPCGMPGGFSSVCIDSRKTERGALFFALDGEHTDGHRFACDALRRGAAGIAVNPVKSGAFALSAAAEKYGAALLSVEDPLTALQTLASAYLDGFPQLLRIGITGSSGKTTTKEIALSICRVEKNVIANAGNLNSETGLPLSVFEVHRQHEIGIFEAGMNRKGEIAELARVLRPQIALITNTGSAHIGFIGSREGIALEKKALFSMFTGNETALIESDGEFSALLAEGVKGQVCYFDKKIEAHSAGLRGWDIVWEGEKARFPLPGAHNLRNALAAAALSRKAGISDRAIRAGLASVRPLFGRAEIIEGAITVVRDCYNANPESTAAAIDLCDELEWNGKRLYVLGSMLELGNDSEAAHHAIGEKLARSKADCVFLFGEETEPMLNIVRGAGKPAFHTGDIDWLRTALKNHAGSGSLILLKGSRGCALERAWDHAES